MKINIEKNEVRGFKVSGEAIYELVWEMLNKCGDVFLDLPENSDTIFHLSWDKGKDELVFYALEFEHPHPVDFESIDNYIDGHIKITTDSLFKPDIKPYSSFFTDEIGKSQSADS